MKQLVNCHNLIDEKKIVGQNHKGVFSSGKKISLCLGILLLAVAQTTTAQINIGTQTPPASFSALEITSTTGGLLHPNLTTLERDALLSGKTSQDSLDARGLMIYNKDTGCLEFFKNRTEGWVSLCNEITLSNLPFDNTVIIRPLSTAAPSDGKVGKAKYDIAKNNSSPDGTCGVIGVNGRTPDFNSFADFKRYYEVVFPSADNGRITDLVLGTRQYLEEFITVESGAIAGAVNNSIHGISIRFNPNINLLAAYTKESSALRSTLFAVFKRDGVLHKVEYPIFVMDCRGCGVFAQTAEKEWIPVACYNLGVSSADIVNNANPLGDVYQWGRKADGHEKINSQVYSSWIGVGELTYPTAPRDSLDANGQPAGIRSGKFIPVTASSQNYFFEDWSVAHREDLWGDGSQHFYAGKSLNDPCPAGFRIPTEKEWEKIRLALTVNNKAGVASGEKGDLVLPEITARDKEGNPSGNSRYWTSTVNRSGTRDSEANSKVKAFSMGISASTVETIGRAYGAAIRCVPE
jgi:hypothetical protein